MLLPKADLAFGREQFSPVFHKTFRGTSVKLGDGSVVGVWFHSFKTDREPLTSCSLLLISVSIRHLADTLQGEKQSRSTILSSAHLVRALIALFLILL